MSNAALHESALDLAWRLWTELGVPGVQRFARAPVVDPEPLVLWSAGVVEADPRLRDLVFAWCHQHGDRLSASRLRGLLPRMPASVVRFGALAAALNATSNLRWPGASTTAPPWPTPQADRPIALPLERPALVRLRLRALCGVGARADVLCELLAADGGWVEASDGGGLGYSKRSVGRILAELESGRVARSLRRGNALRYQLVDPTSLRAVVSAPDPMVAPRWSAVFGLSATLIEGLARLGGEPPIVQRVEAHRLRDEVHPSAIGLGLPAPPVTAANPDAFAALTAWALDTLRAVGEGSSPALGPT